MDPVALARALHTVTEPFHSLMYFSPEVQQQLGDLGLEPRAQGYFALRAAPMGRVGPGAAAATFYNFNPAVFAHMFPSTWDLAAPQDVLQARATGIQQTYERIAAPVEGLEDATGLACEAVDGMSMPGRPLAAANADVDPTGMPFADLWQAVAVLREHRGDGHIAALVTRDVGAVEALVLFSAWQAAVSRRFLQRSRLWDDAAWADAEESLRIRGWMDGDGSLTDAGRQVRDDVEADTDRLAAAPYARLGEDRCRRLFGLVHPLVVAIAEAEAYPRPVTVPDPL